MPEPARLLDVTATAAYLGGICADSVRALVARGALRAALFSWDRTASETFDAYRTAVGE